MQVVAAEFSGYRGKIPLLSNPQWFVASAFA